MTLIYQLCSRFNVINKPPRLRLASLAASFASRSLEVEEYANMLLLHRMMALLEEEVRDGKESKIGKFITKEGYEAMIKKVRNLSVRNIACDALWSPFITS